VSAIDAGALSIHLGRAALAARPAPRAVTVSSDSASALPNWLLIALLGLVALVVIAMFGLTLFSMSAPRSTLKNVIGRGSKRGKLDGVVTEGLVKDIADDARTGKRTTRTTLAIAGFSLLGVVVVAIFGLSGQGVRDLRSQVVAAVTTLAATIAGFYFGAQTASKGGGSGGSVSATAAAAKTPPPPDQVPSPDTPDTPDTSDTPGDGTDTTPTVPADGPDANINAGRAGGFSAS
jgi:hypothetical protein